MTHEDKKRLSAEQHYLEELLEGAGDLASTLTMRSLQLRLNELVEEQQTLETSGTDPARVTLTFRGDPVVGTHGIFAQFASNALTAFINAVSAVGASMRRGLKPDGRLPDRLHYRFLVTGVARSSFGFVLEEVPTSTQQGLGLDIPTPAAQALERTLDILDASKSEDEEAVSETIADLDSRAVNAVRLFVKRLDIGSAHGSLEADDRQIVFTSVRDVRAARAMLDRRNVSTQSETLAGIFLGALPDDRRFEFEVETLGVIKGGIDKSVDDPIRFNKKAGSPAQINVQVTRVGSASRKYVLLADPVFGDSPASTAT